MTRVESESCSTEEWTPLEEVGHLFIGGFKREVGWPCVGDSLAVTPACRAGLDDSWGVPTLQFSESL